MLGVFVGVTARTDTLKSLDLALTASIINLAPPCISSCPKGHVLGNRDCLQYASANHQVAW